MKRTAPEIEETSVKQSKVPKIQTNVGLWALGCAFVAGVVAGVVASVTNSTEPQSNHDAYSEDQNTSAKAPARANEDEGSTIPKKRMKRECSICYAKEVDSVYIPCGHSTSCLDCSQQWLETHGRCPICRKMAATNKIYHS